MRDEYALDSSQCRVKVAGLEPSRAAGFGVGIDRIEIDGLGEPREGAVVHRRPGDEVRFRLIVGKNLENALSSGTRRRARATVVKAHFSASRTYNETAGHDLYLVWGKVWRSAPICPPVCIRVSVEPQTQSRAYGERDG